MVLIDVDTQMDFMLPAGALYVPGAERLIPVLGRIFEKAQERGMGVISSTDAHAENDPEFADWPAHCVAGALGQQKIPETLWKERIVVSGGSGMKVERRVPQIILEKPNLDMFSDPLAFQLLELYPGEECVVVGVATEYCVRYAIEGLLKAGRKVKILTDAIGGIDRSAAERVLAEAVSRGARLTTSEAAWA